MVANRLRMIAAGCVACAALAVPATASAQSYRYADDEPAVVVECAPGQRAVMAQRRVNGATQVVARCEGTAQTVRARTVSRSNVQYVERAPRRTKTKTALMIAGSAATGAGVGGALKGKKGAIIGAAIGGGSASIYEAAKRR
ncbi:MAG TPA: hypothetical protein VJ691_03865 [Vicinamibacterales bacterium]|nr:hypothetical protein [Vicinamibacterales bacterium]